MSKLKYNYYKKYSALNEYSYPEYTKELALSPIETIQLRAKTIKLPKAIINRCIADIQKWYLNNGPEWTVDRLKYIKQFAIIYKVTGKPPKGGNDTWVKTCQNGMLAQHWGALVKMFKQHPKSVALFLQCYTVFKRKDRTAPSQKMIDNYRKAITKPFSGDEVHLDAFNWELKHNVRGLLKAHLSKDDYQKLILRDIELPGNILLNARLNNESQKEELVWSTLDFLSSDMGKTHMKQQWVRDAIGVWDYKEPDLSILGIPYTKKPLCVANVNWIHEPGMKERVVCDFSKVIEHLTFKLGERLYDILEVVPWDSSYHEVHGYRTIQNSISRLGGKKYCFDLSKATDRFPLSTQKAVLEGLFGDSPNAKAAVALFLDACKQEVELPDGTRAHFEVGQPMGAYPSFALFSLTHGLVIMHLLDAFMDSVYGNQFVVHGDDMTILDENLADYYRYYTEISGVEVNDFKTIISEDFCEFNSRLISSKGIIRFPKWKEITPDSLMDAVEVWGPACIDWVYDSRKTRRKVRTLLSIPHILPSGNSINPEGLTLQERLDRIPDSFTAELCLKEMPRKNLMSYRRFLMDRITYDITSCRMFLPKKNFINDKALPGDKRVFDDLSPNLKELYRKNNLSDGDKEFIKIILGLNELPEYMNYKYILKKPIWEPAYTLSPNVADVYLQMLLGATEEADTLDREVLQEWPHGQSLRIYYNQVYSEPDKMVLYAVISGLVWSISNKYRYDELGPKVKQDPKLGNVKTGNKHQQRRKSQTLYKLDKLAKKLG